MDEDIDIVRENAEKGGMVQGQVEKVEGSKGEETEERKIGRKKGGKSDGEMERKRHEEMEIAKEEERIEGGDGDDNILGRGEGDDNTDGEGDDEVEGEGDGDGDDDIEREGDGNDDIGREGDGDDDIERDGDDDIEGEGEGEGGSEIEGAQEGQGGGGDLVAVSVSLRGVTAAANSPSPSIVPISAPTSKPGRCAAHTTLLSITLPYSTFEA